MSRQAISLGTVGANGRDGDDNRTAFTKINNMTLELYGAIEEEGTNANGSYIKFVNGTLITWGNIIRNMAVPPGQAMSWGGLTADQPFAFVGKPIIVSDIGFYQNANAGGLTLYGSKFNYPGLDGGIISAHLNTGIAPAHAHPGFTIGTFAAASVMISFHCMGKWK